MRKITLYVLTSLLLISAVSASDIAADIGDQFIVFDPELLGIDDFGLIIGTPGDYSSSDHVTNGVTIVVEEYEKLSTLYELKKLSLTRMNLHDFETTNAAQQYFDDHSEDLTLAQNISMGGYNGVAGIGVLNSPSAYVLLDENTVFGVTCIFTPGSVEEFLQFIEDLKIYDGSIQEMIQRNTETET